MTASAKTVALLGAGASAEAGVPTTFEATERLVHRINERAYDLRPIAAALHFVCGALLAYDGAEGQNPFSGLDVERVFAAVQLLAERNTLEVSPFVGSWHRAVDALDSRSRTTIRGNFDRRFKQALEGPDSFGGVRKLMTDLIDDRTGSAASGATYRDLASAMLAELRDLVATTPKKTTYLRPLVTKGTKRNGLTIATLNYDLSVEQAASALGVPCTTGVERWLETGRWHWPSRGIRLLKLHGSINWHWERAKQDDGHLPREALCVAEDLQPDVEDEDPRPGVVFGHRGKVRAQGPFLGLLSEFEKLLGEAQRLVIIGYSFRDDHINDVIQRWTLEDINRTIVVVDPNWPEEFPFHLDGDFRAMLDHYLLPPEWEDQPSFAPRLEVRREKCSEALPALFPEPKPRRQAPR